VESNFAQEKKNFFFQKKKNFFTFKIFSQIEELLLFEFVNQ